MRHRPNDGASLGKDLRTLVLVHLEHLHNRGREELMVLSEDVSALLVLGQVEENIEPGADRFHVGNGSIATTNQIQNNEDTPRALGNELVTTLGGESGRHI